MRKCRTTSVLVRFLAILVGLVFTSAIAVAQNTTGNLQGVVKDPNGGVVAGATVKITNAETGALKETTTNDEGFFRVTNLIPGEHYKIEVTAQGFAPRTVDNVVVRLAVENTADVDLAIAGTTGEVTVTAEQPLIQTTQNQLSQAYTPRQLQQLPINGGLLDNIALLTPGVVTPGDADFTNGVGISANGNRGRSNNFQIDGQDNNDNSVAGPSTFISNTEAVGEYQIITNNFSAEFGRNSGAQINIITKPGTNEFHGSVFEYYRGQRLRALDNLDKKAGAAYKFLVSQGFSQYAGLANRQGEDPFDRHRFGGAIGGPLKKNKAFFFVTYQRDRQTGEVADNNFTSDNLVPTGASTAAVCASGAFPIGCGILQNTGAGGGPIFAQGVGTTIVGPPLIDTNGDGIADALAYPGNPGGLVQIGAIRPGGAGPVIPLLGGEITRITRNEETEDQLITREDFNLTSKDVLGIRYIYDKDRFPNGTFAVGRFLAGAFFDVPSFSHNIGTKYTRTLSAHWTNEASFNFSRLNVSFGDTSTRPGPEIGFTGTRSLSGDFLLTFGTQNNLPQSRVVDVYQEQDTIGATLGNHALKTGVDFRQQKVENFFLPNFLGRYQFGGSNPCATSNSATSGLIPAGTPLVFGADNICGTASTTSRTGFRATSIENVLLGRPRQITFALGNPLIKTTQNDYFFFFQDDWRVRSNLTLNLGARYEISTTPFNPIIDQVNAREANASTAIFDTSFPLSTRTATKLPLDKNNFAPRIGFAYSPEWHALGDRFTGGRTVLRGGFGIAYDPSFFNIVLNTVTAAPYAAAGIFRQTPGGAGSVVFPFLPSTTAQLNTTPGTNGGDPRLFNQTRVDPNFHNPYTMSFNFGIQQELFKNNVLEVRYVGSRIIGQFQTINGNPDVHFLNQAAQCLGLSAGAFSNGIVVGTPAATAADACSGSGFNNRPGTNGNGRIDPAFGAVRTRINGASATYHGLQMRFDTRFANSLTLNANYTLSKTLDNVSEIFSTGGGGQGVADPQRFFDQTNGERGLSAFHQKHNFTTNFIYDLPWYKDQRGVVGHALGGYQISGLIRMGSGRPYQPLEAFGTYDPVMENAFFGVGALRPFNGNPSAPHGTIAYGVSTACFVLFGGPECNDPNANPGNFIIYDTLNPGSIGRVVTPAQAQQQARYIYNDFGMFNQFGVPLTPAAGAGFWTEAFNLFRTPFGDMGRNTQSGLPFYLVNLAIFKTTKLTENTKLEFRVEAENLLNRRNFGVPDAFTEDASFGNFVGSFENPGFNNGSQRQLRLGLRFIF